MLIRNKKTGLEYEISEQGWQQIKDSGKQVLYKVIDISTKTASKVNVPKEIFEFQINLPKQINPQPINPEKINIFKKPQHKSKK